MSEFDDIPEKAARLAHLETTDDMRMGLLWFQNNGIEPTAADLLKYAQLVRAATDANREVMA